MRKLLSILGSIAIAASSASAVVACGSTTKKAKPNQDLKLSDSTQQSLEAIKPLVLADSYGLDLNKTNNTIDKINNYPDKNSNFTDVTSSAVKDMNLNGTLGRDNAPLYSAWDMISKLLGKFKIDTSKIDVPSYINEFGSVIKEIPYLFKADGLTGVLSLVPVILQNVVGLIPKVDMGPKTAAALIKTVSNVSDTVLSAFDMDSIVKNAVVENGAGDNPNIFKLNAGFFIKKGADAFNDLIENVLFKKYSNVKSDSSDSNLSAFLGKYIFTPLLNGDSIDKQIIDDLLSNIESNIASMINDISAIVTSLSLVFSLDKQNGSLNPDSTNPVSSVDGITITYNKKTNQMTTNIDANKLPVLHVSVDSFIDGAMNLITDKSEKNQGIIKLARILFSDQTDGSHGLGGLTDKLSFWIVDALKYTDYNVVIEKGKDDKGNPIPISVNVSVGDSAAGASISGTIYSEFNLKDLFTKGFSVDLGKLNVSITLLTVKNDLGNIVPKIEVSSDEKSRGLLDDYSSVFTVILEDILTGKDLGDGTDFENAALTLLGDKNSSFRIDLGSADLLKNNKIWPLIWKKLWDGGLDLKDLLNNIFSDAWFDEDKFNKNLDALTKCGVSADSVKGIEEKTKGVIPLVDFVDNALSNLDVNGTKINVISLVKAIRIDPIIQLLKILLVKNTIQDSAEADGEESLFGQILESLVNDDDTKLKWSDYLGYVNPSDVQKNSLDATHKYVLSQGLIGNIVALLYPEFDSSDYNGVTASIGKDEAIDLDEVIYTQSDVIAAIMKEIGTLARSLQGLDLTPIISPLLENKKAWNISDVKDTYYNGTKDLQNESYVLTFDSSSVSVSDGVKSLPTVKAKYKITFSRIDKDSMFSIKSIEKLK